MLSRFSSLFAYVVVGLAISAAATPMGQARDLDDGSMSSSSLSSSSYSDSSSSYSDSSSSSYSSSSQSSSSSASSSLYSSSSSSSYPSPTPSNYPGDKLYPMPYADDKSYPDPYTAQSDPEEKKYPQYPQDKPYAKPDDKVNSYGNRHQDQYPPQNRPYGMPDDKYKSAAYTNQTQPQRNSCNVGSQECCNTYNEVSRYQTSCLPIRY
jgi:hypothetical protein